MLKIADFYSNTLDILPLCDIRKAALQKNARHELNVEAVIWATDVSYIMPRALGFYFYCCKFNIRHFISHPDISALKRVTFLNNVVQSVDVWPQAYHNSAEFYPAVAGSVDIPLKIFLMQPKAIIRIKTFSGKTCIDSASFRGYYSATVKRMKVTVGQTHIIAPIDGIFFTTWKIDGSLVPERMCDLSCRERGEVVLALSHALYGPVGCFIRIGSIRASARIESQLRC